MAKRDNISMLVIRRLPRYYRFLTEIQAEGVMRISSKELADKMNLTASQVRQDFNCFGGFGQQGYGYSVEQLKNEIESILGLSKPKKAILVGAGNLGRAVASHMAFEPKGISLIGIFDKNEKLIGTKLRNVIIADTNQIEPFCKRNLPNLAILCVPKEAAEHLCRRLYNLGIRYYWNFSHYDLTTDYSDVVVENVHMSDSLMTLCYRISDDIESHNKLRH
ncbi:MULTISPECIES: redox-sensing transcriptional repressor Rex [unclassified Ruminococcus]|uniref:redox-sensing transcriptional repressor Rex n=1 Tax=unclassified Ruminococcus TaxID=2608920 RepID=UPI00210ACB7C|nr:MULTISPECIES: redox-sensing transcriptional repressor Rex [unclassified Ruminococcus]MCQ4022898.1 redox-sensing transcriptional repressor Rex [Ruminococcus sp. zg-924]MCQ4115286.1 redox-sensing transcriptional repressor Rex [Ruminococcus sp. zg-921]